MHLPGPVSGSGVITVIDENTFSIPIVLGVGGAMDMDMRACTRACLLHLGVELPRVEK